MIRLAVLIAAGVFAAVTVETWRILKALDDPDLWREPWPK
jgi:hypothetical protein